MFTIQRIVARKTLLHQIEREEEHELRRRNRNYAIRHRKKSQETLLAKKKQLKLKKSRSFSFGHIRDACVQRLCAQQKLVETKFFVSPRHVRALLVTWTKISRNSRNSGRGKVTIMHNALTKTQQRSQFLRTIYYKPALLSHTVRATTVRDHANFLAFWFDDIITRLDLASNNPDSVYFDKKGQRVVTVDVPVPQVAKHAALKNWGMDSSHWEILGECLCETIYICDCVRCYPDAPKAWRIFIATLIDVLRAEFDRFCVLTRCSSAPVLFAQEKKCTMGEKQVVKDFVEKLCIKESCV